MSVRSPALALLVAALAALLARADEAPAPPVVVEAAGLALRVPTGWKSVPPASQMRAAQLEVPGPGGAAELTMFFFGVGQGGDWESNATRWLGQIEQGAGATPARGDLASASNHTIHWVEAAGTLKPSMMGAGPKEPVPGSRLVGAMIEGEGGPWFLKLTGPEATVLAAKDAFLMMLRSAAPAAPAPPPAPAPAQ